MGIYGSVRPHDEPAIRAISMDGGGKAYYGDGDPDLTIYVSEAAGWHDRVRLEFDFDANDFREEPRLELLLPPAEARRLIAYLQLALERVDPQ